MTGVGGGQGSCVQQVPRIHGGRCPGPHSGSTDLASQESLENVRIIFGGERIPLIPGTESRHLSALGAAA